MQPCALRCRVAHTQLEEVTGALRGEGGEKGVGGEQKGVYVFLERERERWKWRGWNGGRVASNSPLEPEKGERSIERL